MVPVNKQEKLSCSGVDYLWPKVGNKVNRSEWQNCMKFSVAKHKETVYKRVCYYYNFQEDCMNCLLEGVRFDRTRLKANTL